MKADIIIQARFNATRLPGKVLLKILDKTILEYVVERVLRAEMARKVIVATTTHPNDDAVFEMAKKAGVEAIRGSEEDLCDRFYQAAKQFDSEHVVRITADCPLIDPNVIDAVIRYYFETGADFCCNVLEETYPDGQDVEVFSCENLKKAFENAELPSEREHVTPYFKNHPEIFHLVNLKNEQDESRRRWTLDQEEDYQFIKAVIEALYPENPNFSMQDIIHFLNQNPELEYLNHQIPRNEGFLRALEDDRRFRELQSHAK